MHAAARSTPPFDAADALKDAGKVAAITVLLTIALVGFHTQDTSLGPPLEFRFDDVVALRSASPSILLIWLSAFKPS